MTRWNQPFYGQGLLSEQEKTVRIPVRICADGRIEYFYGGDLPGILDGTTGDLVVPEWSLTDQREVTRLQQEHVVEILPSGSVVMFAVDGNKTPAKLREHLKDAERVDMKKSHAVALTLGEPLRLRLRGTKYATLEGVNCWIPSLRLKAGSLNHAYRLVSERFEPSRISHSGNVFKLGYCKPGDRWISLDVLRDSATARFEMLFIRTAAEVFVRLPERVGSVLRECWGGLLPRSRTLQRDTLLADLDRWRSKSLEAHNESALADIHTTHKLMWKMLASISDTTSDEYVRLLQAAVKYLLHEEDEQHDTEFPIRFEDDALVVRTIAEVLASEAQ